MFETVLVANRGEIAARIVDVLRQNEIKSIAIYSEADAESPHVKRADKAICIGPAPVGQSYLNQDAIIQVAIAESVDAIHPGYGLLSENAGFARRCEDAGIRFIGPTSEVIEAMGDKVIARESAERAGVPVVPGSKGPITDIDAAHAIAEQIGYPVLVKAAGGGGGIGMALVKRASKLPRAIESCRDRGESSFGNASVYLEKYIESPRHIEVQVLFDQHGHGIHLFERECTLQRRHQKVIEEAPSPFVSTQNGLRDALCSAALKAAHAIGYRNAGTVEFVMAPSGEFYFIEMNTRLQVEHPVTEAITGVDLITWQLKIASGEKLSIAQDELKIQGAAVECRLYAEEPEKMFLPRPGEIGEFSPPEMDGVRVDSGVESGATVTQYYDPMIAKLTAHSDSRETALELAARALDQFKIEKLTTNRVFLGKVLRHPAVREGEFDTKWLERYAKGQLD
ncbi:MAG: biotin carboxylase [Myxococcales bacterium]|nr:biotin carboxylase [Myxococcales bacterium]